MTSDRKGIVRRSAFVPAALLAVVVLAQMAPASAAVSFTRLEGFATKTGFRGIITWQASEPIAATVSWGTTASTLSNLATPVVDVVDRAGIVIIQVPTDQALIYYRVTDNISGVSSTVKSFKPQNAYNSYASGAYTINLLVALDSPAAPDSVIWDLGVNDIAAGVNILAERLYDATDGYVKIGTVLVTDTLLNNPANVPARGTVCRSQTGAIGGTAADFLVQTTVPFDSHTWSGHQIDSLCTGIYLGRLGWLVVPWDNDLDLGYTMVHELAHYAFSTEDLYSATSSGGCVNDTYDISVMHNAGGYRAEGRWRQTEFDRTATATCPAGTGGTMSSWDHLRERYTNVPVDNSPAHVIDTAERGNADGGSLRILTLRQSPAGSTLSVYTPVD